MTSTFKDQANQNIDDASDAGGRVQLPSPGLVDRCLIGAIALLLFSSVGAFFWFVPVLPLLASLMVMVGLIVSFGLGIYFGNKTPMDSPRS